MGEWAPRSSDDLVVLVGWLVVVVLVAAAAAAAECLVDAARDAACFPLRRFEGAIVSQDVFLFLFRLAPSSAPEKTGQGTHDR